MNARQRKTLAAIFHEPTLANIEFAALERLFRSLGAEVVEGSGSRIAFLLQHKRADFHRPHPGKEAKRYQVELAREFLRSIGIEP